MSDIFDAIVIGAGAAGLAAARALGDAGRRVVVLEARGRPGGRILTHRDPAWPLPIELGAEFLHGEAGATRAVANAAGLLVQELPERHAWARGGRWRGLRDVWPSFLGLCARIERSGPDRSFAAFLASRRQARELRTLARMLVEGYHAAPADEVSARSLAVEPEAAAPELNRQYRLPLGQDQLIEWMRATLRRDRVTVRLNAAVTHVRWSRGRVEVAFRTLWQERSRVLRARVAVVTLPVGVLKAAAPAPGSVLFTPALEGKRRALAAFAEARVQKIVLRFRDAFWEDARFAGRRSTNPLAPQYFHDPRSAFPTWWTSAPVASPLLTGWAGGPAAARLVPDATGAPLDAALESVAAALGVTRAFAADRLDGVAYHDWSRDPWSRGAYTFLRVGGASAPASLARPLDDTLFFAGESTNVDETGTVSGAIASGLRAAREIVELRPARGRLRAGTLVARRIGRRKEAARHVHVAGGTNSR
jgi:monoamine oxidase